MSPDTPVFRVLCQTSWTVRAECLKSIQTNYFVPRESVLERTIPLDVRTRVIGVRAQMESFN